MYALQRPKQYPYGIPPWDNKSRTYFRKQWKENRAWYSKNYAQGLPRKAKKKLMREWAESVWDAPEDFFLMPLSDEDPIRRQFYHTFIWRSIPGAYVSPLAPVARRKRQRRRWKHQQRYALENGVFSSPFMANNFAHKEKNQ